MLGIRHRGTQRCAPQNVTLPKPGDKIVIRCEQATFHGWCNSVKQYQQDGKQYVKVIYTSREMLPGSWDSRFGGTVEIVP